MAVQFVQFFASCLVELLRPDVGAATQRVLRAGGHDPRPVRGATCCGQPAYNAGYVAEARRVARRTLRALGDAAGDVPCVVASGSCATMMSHHWPGLFEGTAHAEAARRAAARTVELTAFLTAAAATGGGEAGPQPPQTGDGAATHDRATTGRAGPDSANPDDHPTGANTGTNTQTDTAQPGHRATTGRASPDSANPDNHPTDTNTDTNTQANTGTNVETGAAQPGHRATTGRAGPDSANPDDHPTGANTDTNTGTNTQAGAAQPGSGRAVLVHDSCHALRELGAGATVRRALSDTGHATVDADGAERCCGFGGSFSVKLPAVSVAMADEKLDSFVATGCEQVTSCDLSCLLHLHGRARRRGLGLRFDHVATLLDRES